MQIARFAPTLLLALLTIAPAVRAAPADPLQTLIDGNRRYAAGASTHPDQDDARRAAVATAQRPFAVVVGCADSRVPPELLFDQGLGDVFVVRSAGQVVDAAGLGSIEFAVANLGASLIVVLGHERCGAVDATLRGAAAPGHVGALVDVIRPRIAAELTQPPGSLDDAIGDNVRAGVAQLRAAEPILAPRVRDGALRIVGGVYDLDTGLVTIIDPAGAQP